MQEAKVAGSIPVSLANFTDMVFMGVFLLCLAGVAIVYLILDSITNDE